MSTLLRLNYACQKGVLDQSNYTSTLLIGCNKPEEVFPDDQKKLSLIHSQKDISDKAKACGIKIGIYGEKYYDLVILSIPRSKSESFFLISKAFRFLKQKKTLIIEGQKENGIDSIINQLKKYFVLESIFAKGHGKLVSLKKPQVLPNIINMWENLGNPKKIESNYVTIPGVFSESKIDPASRFLAEVSRGHLKGCVADFGSGWGYLSAEALKSSQQITTITLYEINYYALQISKINVSDERATFEWVDILTYEPKKIKFDTIVCNPPFHNERKTDSVLGIRFIEKASTMLTKKGIFWLVANIHLPYENTLKKHFFKTSLIEKNKLFKVYKSERPKLGL